METAADPIGADPGVLAKRALDALPGHVAIVNAEGVICFVNESWRRFGVENGLRSANAALGVNYLELCAAAAGSGPEETAEQARAGILRLLKGETQRFELEYPCHSPEVQRWFRLLATPLKLEDGSSGAVLLHTDITCRYLAERKLHESEERFQLAVRGAAAGIWDWDMRSGHVYRSERYLEILGYKRDELPDQLQSGFALVHPDDRAKVLGLMEEHLEHRTPYHAELRMRKKDGRYIWVSTRGQAIWDDKNHPYRMAGSIEDVTERKETEESIRKHKELLETILQHVPAMVVFLEEGRVIWANRCWEETLGYRLEEASGQDVCELFVPDPTEREAARKYALAHSQGWQVFRATLRDGRVLDTSWAVVLLSDGTVVAIGQDVTERIRAEARMREQAALLDEAPDAILVKDLQGRIVFWSKGAERIYGCPAADAAGRNARELLGTSYERWLELRTETLLNGQWSGELQERKGAGQTLFVQSRWTLLRDSRGEPKSILIINTDITEKKKLETSFLRAQRMESIGTLAGGIAHDLNNVLSPIMLAIAILREKVTSEEDQNMMDTLQASAERGANLVKQVLSFARGVDGSRLPVNPFHLAREVQKIIRDTFPKNIDCRLKAEPGLWGVVGDPTQLHQVLLNLCVNARDAMPEGGELRIEFSNAEIDETYAQLNPDTRSGKFVLCKVTDTGSGIPQEIVSKIFEPFFTTKEIGKGTGLGLATVQAIVKSHRGFVTVYSELRKGTTFKVFIPASPETVNAAEAKRTADLPRGRGETILVVDDEEPIRLVAQRTLEQNGYRVMLASNGAEAVSAYAAHREKIAAVLTDMAMPIMDGPTTVLALRTMNPEVKVLGSSGLAAQRSLARVAGVELKHFVPKPYTAETLLKELKAVLAN